MKLRVLSLGVEVSVSGCVGFRKFRLLGLALRLSGFRALRGLEGPRGLGLRRAPSSKEPLRTKP